MDADLSESESDSDARRRKRRRATNRAASARYYQKHPENREKKRVKVQQMRWVAFRVNYSTRHYQWHSAKKKLKKRHWDPPKRIIHEQLGKFPSEDLNLLTPRTGTPVPTHDDMVQALEQDMQEFEERMEKAAIASLSQLFQSHNSEHPVAHNQAATDSHPTAVNAHEQQAYSESSMQFFQSDNSEQLVAHTQLDAESHTSADNAYEQQADRVLHSEEYSHMLPEEKAAHKPSIVRLLELRAARRAHRSRLAADQALNPWRIHDEELRRVHTIHPVVSSGYVFPPDLPPSDDPGTSSESDAESGSEWD
ncbi:hypothetical protein C8R43DRAFT_1138777 [Mycena crocata]|nr:hypothetical protein C8R43DRAFT_1138777 [Mycena crocata]